MAAPWSEAELAAVRRFLEEKGPRPVVRQDLITLGVEIGRPADGVKKKIRDMKVAARGEEMPQGCIRRARSPVWGEEEVERLARRYTEQTGENKSQRLRNIAPEFPIRTVSAMAERLKNRYPEIYYLEAGIEALGGGQEEVDNATEPQWRLGANEAQREITMAAAVPTIGNEELPYVEAVTIAVPPTTIQQQMAPQGAQAGHSEEVEAVDVEGEILGAPNHCTEPETPEEPEAADELLLNSFRKMMGNLRRFRRGPQFRSIKINGPINFKIAAKIDKILACEIRKIQTGGGTYAQERRKVKEAILVAVALLKQESEWQKDRRPPPHIVLGRVVRKLQRKVRVAVSLRRGRPLTKAQRALVRELRRTHTSLRAHITMWKDRLTTLEERVERQREAHKTHQLRERFMRNPTKKVLQGRPEKPQLETDVVERYFQELFKAEECDRPHTPVFNNWIGRLRQHQSTNTMEVSETTLDSAIKEVLSQTRPWKAAGEDGVPTGAYKAFPSAEQYLSRFVKDTLSGKKELAEVDVRGRVVLIYKSGEKSNPANYRPIAVLNTDYKILTGVITNLTMRSLPHWAIPREQLARSKVWGTVQGMMMDKAHSQAAKSRASAGSWEPGRPYNHSAWYDFSKAYDSIHHWQLIRLINALPLPPGVIATLKAAVKRWSIVIQVGQSTTRPVRVARGVYQGDTVSPLLFILMTAGILQELVMSRTINRVTKGQHLILAFMDDIKVHAPTKEGVDVITETLSAAASEVGLHLNMGKCGHYVGMRERDRVRLMEAEAEQNGEEGDEDLSRDEAVFLPEVREGYKYLGITQLERDTGVNGPRIQAKIMDEVQRVLASNLAVPQKVQLLNTAVVPAATYVLGNIYPQEQNRATLKRCRDLDTAIRVTLVRRGVKPYAVTGECVYLPTSLGGLGLLSIEYEVEKQQVRRGLYIKHHPEMAKARKQFEMIKRRKLRNPLTDAERIMTRYGVAEPEYPENQEEGDVGAAMSTCRRVIRELEDRQMECRAYRRRTKVAYSRTIQELKDSGCSMDIPALRSNHLETWMSYKMYGAMEEQLIQLSAIPDQRRNCPRGCDEIENSYHVLSACISPEYTERHNFVVYWLLDTILTATRAPRVVRDRLNFGSATLFASYPTETLGEVEIRAGGSIATDRPLYHNKPDVVITTSQPKMVYVVEVSVAHIQNLRKQERLKRARYAKNSEVEVTPANHEELPRGNNVLEELRRIHRCDATLGVLVLGALGEVVRTPELMGMLRIASQLGIPAWMMEACLKRSSFSIAMTSCKLLVRRCHAASSREAAARDPRREGRGRGERSPRN